MMLLDNILHFIDLGEGLKNQNSIIQNIEEIKQRAREIRDERR